ncbi:restriction endonuclease subunit S, partial [Helicobacter marmotae]
MGKSQQWQMVKLWEVCELKRGQSITRKQIQEGKIPVIAGGLSPAYYHNQANRNGETIAVAGSGKNAGFVSYWNEPVFLSDSFSVIPNSKALNSKFVFYFLKNRQDYIYTLQIATGVPHIYPSTLQNFSIPLPPL